MSINPGTRVRTRLWGGADGTITRVHADGTTAYVRWDGARFTEDEVLITEVTVIDGKGDPTAPHAVFQQLIERVDSEIQERSNAGQDTANTFTPPERTPVPIIIDGANTPDWDTKDNIVG